MKEFAALLFIVCLAGCSPSPSGSVAISEIETLAASGYRGPIVVSGYYCYHSEQDAIYQKPQPNVPGTPHVLLQMAPILEKANITDWRGRKKFMQVFDRQLVIVTGLLKNEDLDVGGLQTDGPPPFTFVRVEKIELANQPADPTEGTRTGNREAP